MAITREQIENALSMYLDDYVADDNNVLLGEMKQVKKAFDNLYEDLQDEANEAEPDE